MTCVATKLQKVKTHLFRLNCFICCHVKRYFLYGYVEIFECAVLDLLVYEWNVTFLLHLVKLAFC